MWRWITSLLYFIVLGSVAVSGGGNDPLDPSKANPFDYQILKVPVGGNSSSGAATQKKVKEGKSDVREKDILNKKGRRCHQEGLGRIIVMY